MHRIAEGRRDNWDCSRRFSRSNSRATARSQDGARVETDELVRKQRQSLCVPVSEPSREVELFSLDIAEVAHTLQEGFDESPGSRPLAPRDPRNKRTLGRSLAACGTW